VIRWGALRGRASLLTALAASAVFLIAPLDLHTPPTPLQTVAQVWPNAKHATLNQTLADGTDYQPLLYLSATESVGSARTKDGKGLRLLHLAADGKTREIRLIPTEKDPSFPAATLAGTLLVWVESTTRGHQEVWAADVRGGAARRLTADAGDARFYQSQYDLVAAAGRVYWVAQGPDGTTQVRSVAVGGGPTDVRVEPGTWSFAGWPWLSNGVVSSAGTSTLRDVTTGQNVAVPQTSRGVTACSPTWCQVVSITKDGDSRIQLLHPDGTDPHTVATGTPETVISDVAVLDKFEVFANLTPTSELTGNVQLLMYELKTRRTVEISPDCFAVSYRAGILSWSTGTQQSFIRHALDLRTL
jgi:hypothetical protein